MQRLRVQELLPAPHPRRMGASAVDTTLFGGDELGQHRALLEVEQTVIRTLDDLANAPSTSFTAGLSAAVEKTLQQHLASIRSRIRDLELLSEEQDT